MERKMLFKNRLALTSGLLIAGLVFASTAEAGDRDHRRHDSRRAEARADVRDARDYDRRLDRRGRAIDAHLDIFALLAAATGDYGLAYELDRKGDRIERRLDRRGDRALRDARGHLLDKRRRNKHNARHRGNFGHRRDHKWSDRNKHDRKRDNKGHHKHNKRNLKKDSKRDHDKHGRNASTRRKSNSTDRGLRLHRNLIQNRSFR